MRSIAVRAWLVALVALTLAGLGITSLAAGSTVTSVTRMAVAAGLLAGYTAAVALVVTPRAERTLGRCLWWGGLVPVVLALATVALVGVRSGAAAGLGSGLPWLLGALPVCLAGRWLPSLPPLPKLRRPAR